MAKYAEGTEVSQEKSRGEIERTLRRYGADQFISGYTADRNVIGFTVHGRQVRFSVPVPELSDFTHTAGNVRRNQDQMVKAREAEDRRRWRALALAIKAKLEVVETGISTFDEEFMAHIVLPNGQAVGEWLQPQINRAYEQAEMPALLPGS